MAAVFVSFYNSGQGRGDVSVWELTLNFELVLGLVKQNIIAGGGWGLGLW